MVSLFGTAIEFWIISNGSHQGNATILTVCLQLSINKLSAIIHSQGMDAFLEFCLYHLIQIDDCLGCVIFVFQIKCETESRAIIINVEAKSGMQPSGHRTHWTHEVSMECSE